MSRASPVSPGATSVSSGMSGGSRTVIPPIVTNERDREFLRNLTKYIAYELGKIDQNNPEQRYIVYKEAFNMVIDHVTAYKPLLTAVKAEYEDCIETIQRGQREAFYLTGKLKAMSHEPSTIRNYRKRAEELDAKLGIIKKDNTRLQQQLEELRAERKERERKAKELLEPPKRVIKKDRRSIPGLTLAQATDLKTLTKELEKLERQFKELNISHRTRYTPKEFKEQLKEQLSMKVNRRDRLQEDTEICKARRHKLKIAVGAAQAWAKVQPPTKTIGDAVVLALARAAKQHTDKVVAEDGLPRGTPSTTFEDDDPTREKEAEMMLEYIEKFNELLEDRKFEEAAIHAANSPKGILRTPETLNRFKDLKVLTSSGRSPLLAFCDALMSTVLAYGVRPPENMSMECVKCALEENRLDLLSHWISQDRLTVSEQLGHMIYDACDSKTPQARQCLALAQRVYTEVDAHMLAVKCMIRQGRVNQALEYAQQKAHFHSKDYLQMLEECPSIQLAHALSMQRTKNDQTILPLGIIVRALVDMDQTDIGLHLLQDLHRNHTGDVLTESSPLHEAVFADDETTHEQWFSLVKLCQDNGYDEVAVELLAAVTVSGALQKVSSGGDDEANEAQPET